MIFLIRLYQIIVALLLVISVFNDVFHKYKEDTLNCLSLSKWVFYFGAIESFILCFGVAAEIESLITISSKSIESILLILLFLSTIIFGAILMFVQKIWCIRYDDNVILFRNSFGISKKYRSKNIFIRNKKEMVQLFIDDVKVTQWDNRLVDPYDEIHFEKFIEKSIKKQTPCNSKKKKRK